MSNAPDFSSTFDLVDDALSNAEKRLQDKRMAAQNMEKVEPAREAKPEPEKEGRGKSSESQVKYNAQVKTESEPERSKPTKKKPNREEVRAGLKLVAKEHRRNLTLKVLEENERKFNELFFKLQLRGDSRKKQDLADEALVLLLNRYSEVLS